MYKKRLKRKGMTLIEVIITLAIFAIAIQVPYSIFFAGNKSFEFSKNKGFAQQEVRLATDFINSELRYINQLDDNPLTGKYYSLEIKNNGDQTYSIEKKEYGEGYEEGNTVKSINGKWTVYISNFEAGKIISTVRQVEGNQEYSIDNFKVALVNNRGLKSDVILSSADEENKKIYYTFPGDVLIASAEEPGEPEEPEEPGEPGEPENIWDSNVAYNGGKEVIYNGKTFVARHYTKGDKPGELSSPWQEITNEWRSFNIYNTGDEVLYSGNNYRAKWYTQNNNPKTSNVWQKIN